MTSETSQLEELFAQYSTTELNITLIALIIGCLFAAFLGFRFFKFGIVLSAALSGYSFGAVTLGMAVGDTIEGLNSGLFLGLACAVICAILAPTFYVAMIYFYGGMFGAMIGFVVPYLVYTALGLEVVGIIVGILAAIALVVPAAKLMRAIIKPYVIITTSLLGSCYAAVFFSILVFKTNVTALLISPLVGIALAVIACIVQFKINEGRDIDF